MDNPPPKHLVTVRSLIIVSDRSLVKFDSIINKNYYKAIHFLFLAIQADYLARRFAETHSCFWVWLISNEPEKKRTDHVNNPYVHCF